jgi:uncharacterized protein (TIGR04255 family)
VALGGNVTEPTALDAICYQTNFLTQVVARVDFLSPVSSLQKELPPAIASSARLYFPIAEPREAVAQELQFAPEVKAGKKTEFTEWNFYSKDRTNRLAISHAALYVSYKAYASYDSLRAEFLSVLEPFLQQFHDVQARRLGLRYVNQVPSLRTGPLDWQGVVDDRMLALISFDQPDRLCRMFHVLEYNHDDFRLRYQFGLHNPDYPALIKQGPFILDLDAFTEVPHHSNEISGYLDRFHLHIQQLFESSIGGILREKLNG